MFNVCNKSTQWIVKLRVKGEYILLTSNISHTLVDNKIVDHSDVVGTSPVGAAAPTTPSFLTARRDEKHLCFGIWNVLY